MSVQPGPTFKRYASNGVATVYAIPFLLLDAADLQVTLNGVLVTTGFTLSGIGNPTSSCTFSVAPTGDLLFQQMVPFQRLADYQINGDFLAQTVNRDFDRLWLAVKQLNRDSSRALTVSLLEPEGIPPLPIMAVRSLKILAFDADGNPIPSNLTMDQLEQQPALALSSAAAAAASANASAVSATNAGVSATASADSAVLSQSWAANPEDVVVSGGLYSARHYAAKAAANAIWGNQPIGMPFPIWDHIAGVPTPPTNNSAYRYIKLTASDSYNTGVLIGESVSGSAPLVLATAVVNDALSPINGRTVQLINTERRFIRAGSSGTLETDALQGHIHQAIVYQATGGGQPAASATATSATTVSTGGPLTDGTNGTPRTANETRAKNIGATFYMRIR